MRRIWLSVAFLAVLAGTAFLFLTERPLTVAVVQPEADVALRIYGLGTVEARILSRVGFEVGAALTGLAADAGDRVGKGQELASLHAAEQEARVARIGLESDRVNEERRVWLACADCPTEMFLGEQAEVRILTGTRAQALMVPELAITGFDGHRGTVWTLAEGRLARADLTFGARDDRGRVEVTGGLPDGAAIVARVPKGAAEGRRARIGAGP
ncbi:hypothetical protein [Paracoccus sp. (in: a-proteobacteria)]|uniref:hypothetical protein n=1 Tax=Paracoccus sp. TaxID=267 RepID=UPI0032205047